MEPAHWKSLPGTYICIECLGTLLITLARGGAGAAQILIFEQYQLWLDDTLRKTPRESNMMLTCSITLWTKNFCSGWRSDERYHKVCINFFYRKADCLETSPKLVLDSLDVQLCTLDLSLSLCCLCPRIRLRPGFKGWAIVRYNVRTMFCFL